MIQKKYGDQGFRVLAFPANNFLNQEPGSNAKIKKFCTKKNVTFDVFAKVSVKGKNQTPLYAYLTGHPDESIGGKVAWNFQKYLIDREGKVVAKFHPKVAPEDSALIEKLEAALASGAVRSGS